MPSGRWQLVTMVFLSDPSEFIAWMQPAFSSRTNRRPVAALARDVGRRFLTWSAVMSFPFVFRAVPRCLEHASRRCLLDFYPRRGKCCLARRNEMSRPCCSREGSVRVPFFLSWPVGKRSSVESAQLRRESARQLQCRYQPRRQTCADYL